VTCVEKRFHGPEENYTNAFSKTKSFITEDAENLSHKVYDLVNFYVLSVHGFMLQPILAFLKRTVRARQFE
jgi:hypothetical protein